MFSRIHRSITSAHFSLWVIGLMVFLPFIIAYHQLPIPSFYAEWVAFLLGIIAFLPLLKRDSWQPLYIPQISLIFAGFVAIVCMQLMLGMVQSVHYGLLVIGYLVWAFLLVILGAYLRRQLGWEKIAITIAWAIFAGGLLNIVFVSLQYMAKLGFQLSFMPNFSAFGAIGQLNHFANYMALCIASILYLFFKKRFTLLFTATIGLLFLAMLAISGSRSTWLYLLVLTGLAALLRHMLIRQITTTNTVQLKQSHQLLWLTLLLLPLFGVVQLLMGLLTSGLVALPNQRLMAELGGTQPIGGIAVRLHIWTESLLLFLQSPWLGIGVGQTRWMSFYMLDQQWLIDLPGAYEHAHNLVVQLLAEMGLAGGLLLLAGVFAWLRGFHWRQIQLETWYVLAILSIIGIHSMLEYPLWYAYFLGLTAFLLGAGDEKCHQLKVGFSAQIVGRVAIFGLLLVAIGLCVTTFVANKTLEHWIKKGIQQGINRHNQAQFYDALDWVADYSILKPYIYVINAISLAPNNKNVSYKIALSEAAMRFKPTRSTAYRYVLFLELNQHHALAVQYLRRAIQAYPHDFKPELQKIPQQYWDRYLQLLQEAIAPPEKEKAQ